MWGMLIEEIHQEFQAVAQRRGSQIKRSANFRGLLGRLQVDAAQLQNLYAI